MPTAPVNGIEIFYEHGGRGPRLLFLSGSGATLATSDLLLGPFRSAFDLLAHDQRGLGATTVPAEPATMADYAADALGLLDHVGWDRCRVFGISFGGMVAQELAIAAPERVERMALVCTSPGGAELASYPLHTLADLSPADRQAIFTRLLDTRFDDAWLDAHPGDRALVDLRLARGNAARGDEQRRGEALQLEARRGHDVVDRLATITCPTLVAAGRYDGIAPLANSEAIAARIAGAELRVYEGGHAFIAQDRAALPDVVAFLSVDVDEAP